MNCTAYGPRQDKNELINNHLNQSLALTQPRVGEMRRSQSLQTTTALLTDLVRRLNACGWGFRRIHVFGFSQGGTAAIEVLVTFRGQERLGGWVRHLQAEVVINPRSAHANSSIPHSSVASPWPGRCFRSSWIFGLWNYKREEKYLSNYHAPCC